MVTCSTCQRQLPDSAATCPHDGTDLRASKEAAPKHSTGTLMRPSGAGIVTPRPSAQITNQRSSGIAATALSLSTPSPVTPAPPVATPLPSISSLASPPRPESQIDQILTGESQEIVPGTMMGEYEVTGKLGQGGMGEVYAAVHPIIGKKVAVKVLADSVAANREVVRRFVAEARAVNQIGHPNIVDVFSFGQHADGRHYYVMEHLDGKSLEDALEETPLMAADDIVDIFVQTLDALQAAHDAGIIHRDLKPDNIFMTERGGGRSIKLLDFGIAKLSGEEGARTKTQTGMALGTPDYMSPEQCKGTTIDLRTDIYALGVMLYRMFTGHFPFEDCEHVLQLFMKVASEEPPKPSSHRPVPKAFEDIILKCMEKEPSARYSSAKALSDALLAAAGKPGQMVKSPKPIAPAPAQLEGETHNMPSPVSTGTEGEIIAGAGATAILSGTGGETPKRRSYLIPSVVLGGIAAAALAFVVTRGEGDSGEAERPAKTAEVAIDASVRIDEPIAVNEDTADAAPLVEEPPPEPGSLRINTSLKSAEVFVDGESVGTGKRVHLAELGVGTHTIEVRAEGYESERFDLDITPGNLESRNVELKRDPDAPKRGGKKPRGGKDEKKPEVIKDKDQTLDWQ